eukprot:m.181212 g.181212  ORF g.181212 m.181212 type:complete len:313 (+) comp39267_c1_seq25:1011-1949(+)
MASLAFVSFIALISGISFGQEQSSGTIFLSSRSNSQEPPSLVLESPGDVEINCAGRLDLSKCSTAYDLSRGLVAHYTFDNASNLGWDSTPNAYHGQVVGTITQSKGTVGSGSAFFSGTFTSGKTHHYISIPNILNTGAFTVALWANITAPDNHNSFLMLTGGSGFINSNGERRHQWAESSFWFYTSHTRLSVIQNQIDLRYTDFPRSTTFPNLVPRMLDSEDTLNVTWHHIAVTFSEGRVSVYNDGKLVYEFSHVSPVPTTPAQQLIYIGDCLCQDVGHSTSYEVVGSLDDFRIYNRALSDGEIRQLAVGTN